jgi:hypothetical protein
LPDVIGYFIPQPYEITDFPSLRFGESNKGTRQTMLPALPEVVIQLFNKLTGGT